ncbi:hypothetical protein JQ628_08455 [Bradyrhizobium lablabi]|uniref:hypothetical protein n=1 Tax=Bradyrhizobium lablabi TaxID=722472 RepID=UPI001BA77680|nr:hypothetical protein [Bradyrhizobium lablabi]MBR1121538.1 hypothetical protein [Bradyrhizobium lablabi]
MRIRRLLLIPALLIAAAVSAHAFEADGCEKQRKLFPADWNDTSKEKTLFACESQQTRFYVKTGATDGAGRTLMSLVPFSRSEANARVETGQDVLRIWLDKEQTRRLREGRYFATLVRKEGSCWIRGSIEEDLIFLMDNAHPPADDPDKAGSFYNKAPRFSVLGRDTTNCERLK